jgi:phosphoribosylamine---glycine ligase
LRVLVIGGGGREHALVYGIAGSPGLTKLYIAPGNPGTSLIAENVNLITRVEILDFCKTSSIDLVVIGPEKPLVEGLADFLRENGVNVFGPGKDAADLEAHKSFAKQLMQKYNIPTASFTEFRSEEFEKAEEYLRNTAYPVVIKADGLAAGKGVLICENFEQSHEALQEIFGKKVFGNAGNKIIIEEFLRGEEASVFAITDGEDFLCLPAAQDHKRIGDGDKGKNTGGMGAYAPAPLVTTEIQKKVEETIISPVLQAMKAEGRKFTGCLYIGLMINNNEPKVVEFNCRFGDPETQAVIPILSGDFMRLLFSAATGKIDKRAVTASGKSAVCVVAASYGYPGYYDTGFEIQGMDKVNSNDLIIFHAGTKTEFDRVITSGGRVMGLTAVSDDLRSAKEKAYTALRKIHFENIYYRTDISDKAFRK